MTDALQFAEAIVKHWEGCSLRAYHGAADAPNVWTIGWGTIEIDGKPVTAATPSITQSRADELLERALSKSRLAVQRLVGAAMKPEQEAALISFAYNLGEGALGGSTLLKLFKKGDITGAAGEFAKWVHSDGKVVTGLVRRRAAEREVFLGHIPFDANLPTALDNASLPKP